MSFPPLALFVRSRLATFLAPVRHHTLTDWLVGGVIFAFLNAAPATAQAYVFEGANWPAGTTVVLQLGLGGAGRTLIDGNTSWNAAAAPAMNLWDQDIQRARLTFVTSTASVSSGDGVNSVVFSDSIFGQSFGSGTLAVTYYRTQGSRMVEADILFNRGQNFNSYRGALRFGSNGYVIADIRRVMVHELGHVLGLAHPDDHGQHVDAIMNSITSDRETLSGDDIAGGQSLYGAPAPTPTPTPAPTPSSSHLANISTRLNVGVNDDVLIGGFIVRGPVSKRMILRAVGPSLTGAGVSGAMADPTLELHDSAGATIATNDNWQSSAQASEISASGLAPRNPLESAIIATLEPGNYTAIVRGVNNTTGIALVEGYALDSTATRLVNVSTRGQVGMRDDVLIGGFIVTGSDSKTLMVRALGPSLGTGAHPLAGVLLNPVLELHDGSGNLLSSNDDWVSSPQHAAIVASGLAPSNSIESAILITLSPGNYTAIVRGVNNATGIGLVEVYDLDPVQ
jgi:hypothetical protein